MNSDQLSVQSGPGGGRENALVYGGQGQYPAPYRYEGNPYPNYPSFEAPAPEKAFDIAKYLRIASKYKWLIIFTLLTALAVATALTFLMTPIYRSTVSIQIDRESANIVKVEGVQPEENSFSQDFYQTQYELLSNTSLIERVATSLGLVDDNAFNAKATSIVGFVKDLIFGANTNVPENEVEDNVRKTTERLSKMVQVAPVRGSRIVKIHVNHPDPAVAQKIANGFAEVFIEDNLDRRFNATSYARKFLEERLAQLKQRLEESEKQLVRYAEEKGIINLADNKNLATTDLEAINTQLAATRNDRIKRELLWKQAQTTDGLGLKEILDSPAIQENRKLRAQIAAEYQQKLAIYKPAFPDMIQLRNQIRELDRQVETEVESIKSSIEASYLAAKDEEDSLLEQLEGTKGDVVDQRNRSIQYNILQREVDTNRTLYDGLLQRYKEIGIAGGVGTNNISVVDPARKPILPSSPNLLFNLLVGGMIGLLLGVFAALGLDYIDDTFKTPEDIERELGLAVIGVIPKPKNGSTVAEELVDSRSSMAEAMRSLRTGLQFSTSNGLPRTLLVTSSKPSEGKTTSTIALSKSLAHIGLNVLLIDGDLRNSSVHKHLRVNNEIGLSNYLSGAKLPEEITQATDTEGLVLISAGPLPPNPAELLTGARMMSLLSLGAESFDIVIIDGPPIMGLADAPLLSTIAQSTILLVAANETRRNAVKVAIKRIQMARANVIGVLLSKFDTRQSSYGYGYGNYDYHSYGTKELAAPEQR